MGSDRTYQRTHPWINFTLDLGNADHEFWLLLGEAQSKCEHIAGVPLRPDVAHRLHQVFLAKGALATTAIEGNTLTEDEAVRRVQGKLDLPLSREYLGVEIDNVVRACNDIWTCLATNSGCELNVEAVRRFNRQALDGLELKEGITPGEIRGYDVTVGNYAGAPPQDCEYLLNRLCEWLNSPDFNTTDNRSIVFGIIKAVLAHLYIAWIHPFGDGNGRTARLVEYQIMITAGVPSPSAHLLSNHYNLTRQAYYRELEQTSLRSGHVLGFIKYALRGFVDGLHEQLNEIRRQQLEVTWVNYVHDFFRDKNTKADTRRKHLLLDMSLLQAPVPPVHVREISVRVASSYIGKSQKTVARDLRQLESDGLIVRTEAGYRANVSTILAFFPARYREPQ